MPFGAALIDDSVRFRLWAPAAQHVSVYVDGGAPRDAMPMQRLEGGWFELTTAAVQTGARYRYRIDDQLEVPDPASRYQPQDAHGPSEVVDPDAYTWQCAGWHGRPWEEAIIYELHVGSFSPEGSFDGVRKRLDYLAELGVTAIELMPVGDFPGRRSWGYDGVLPFAPDSSYGTTAQLKQLIDAAHARGLMMLLDVVYNHFGPDGNYLHVYAPQFFTDRVTTPWGAAIDFARREVREFVIHNALYWLEEYRFDGLRLDAVHAILDDSTPDILDELAATVHECIPKRRHVHLVLENDNNAAHYLRRTSRARARPYVAQWNDDIHHALHVLATNERTGYYEDYADHPLDHLARCLSEGFAYQGEASRYRGGQPRGEVSADLPPAAFVSFLQNHDQIGNRAFGERLTVLAERQALEALLAVLLLAPSPPLLFMGEEWGATQPFLYFCDFHDALADSVREGRRREFVRFPEFQDPEARARIPDPNAEATYAQTMLDWGDLEQVDHAEWLALYRRLLRLRRELIVPKLGSLAGGTASARRFGAGGLQVTWTLDHATLTLFANLAATVCTEVPLLPQGDLIYTTDHRTAASLLGDQLPPWSVLWFLA